MCLVSNGSLCVANWRLANTTYSQTLKLWRLNSIYRHCSHDLRLFFLSFFFLILFRTRPWLLLCFNLTLSLYRCRLCPFFPTLLSSVSSVCPSCLSLPLSVHHSSSLLLLLTAVIVIVDSAMWKNSLTKYGWVLCISYAHMTYRHGGSLFLFLCPSPSSSFAESVLMHRVRATSLRPSSTFLNAFNPLKEYIQ